MADHLLETRKAMVNLLRASPAVTALVPAASIYGEEVPANPAWPFIMCGLPTATSDPDNACWDTSRLSMVVHVYARGPSMDACSAIAAAVRRALDGQRVVRANVLAIDLAHAQTQIIRDTGEVSDYHGLCRLNADAAEIRKPPFKHCGACARIIP